MEVAGLVISIAQVSGSIIQYINQVKDAPDSCNKLRTQVSSLSEVMMHIGSEAMKRQNSAKGEWAERLLGSNGTLELLLKLLKDVNEKLNLQPTSTQSSTSLSSVNSAPATIAPTKNSKADKKSSALLGRLWSPKNKQKAKPDANKTGSTPPTHSLGFIERVRWPFTDAEVRGWLAEIENHKVTIQLILQSETLARTENIENEVGAVAKDLRENKDLMQEVVADVKVVLDEQTRRQAELLLTWLTPLTFASTQQDIISRWHKGTGEWLLKHELFEQWMAGTRQMLFCPGIPGAGKSVMASMIISHLETSTAALDDTTVIYMYCNYKEQDSQTLPNLLGCLVRQLALKPVANARVLKSIRQLHQKHAPKETRATHLEVSELLHEHISHFSRIYIVIDALDECRIRGQLMSILKQLAGKGNISVLIMSRESARESIGAWCVDNEQFGEIWINPTDEDIKEYLREQFSLKSSVSESITAQLKDDVVNAIASNAKGMFLLAKLHLDNIVARSSAQRIRQALESLRTGDNSLNEAYDAAMQRITDQHEEDTLIACTVISWVSLAYRPLTVVELQHALATQFQTDLCSKFDLEGIIPEKKLISICCGLVMVEPHGRRIRLGHYTTQEYFDQPRNRMKYFPGAHKEIVKASLRYLSFDAFGKCCTSGNELRRRVGDFPFLKYAAFHWSKHAQASGFSGDLVVIIKEFFQMQGNTASNIQIIRSRDYSIHGTTHSKTLDLFHSQSCSRVLVAAIFGVYPILLAEIEAGADCNLVDLRGRSALSLAAELGHLEVVKGLLEGPSVKNLNTNLPDTDNAWPAIVFAIRGGHEEIVKVMCNTPGVNIDLHTVDRSGWTPFGWALKTPDYNENICQTMIQATHFNPNSKDSNGSTPLRYALCNGFWDMVREILFREDIDLEGSTEAMSDQKTLWLWAGLDRHMDVIEFLLTKLKLESWFPGAPYYQAHSYIDSVKLECFKNTSTSDHKSTSFLWTKPGWSPLHLASFHGLDDVVERILLLDDARSLDVANKLVGTDYDADYCGYAPLHLAILNGHSSTVKILLDIGCADPNITTHGDLIRVSDEYFDEHGCEYTPLTLAVQLEDRPDIVEYLLRCPTIDSSKKCSQGLFFKYDEERKCHMYFLTPPPRSTVTTSSGRKVYVSKKRGPELWRTPLEISVCLGNEKYTKMLLADERLVPSNELHIAIATSNLSLMQIILADERFNPNMLTKDFHPWNFFFKEVWGARTLNQAVYIYLSSKAGGSGGDCNHEVTCSEAWTILQALLDCPSLEVNFSPSLASLLLKEAAESKDKVARERMLKVLKTIMRDPRFSLDCHMVSHSIKGLQVPLIYQAIAFDDFDIVRLVLEYMHDNQLITVEHTKIDDYDIEQTVNTPLLDYRSFAAFAKLHIYTNAMRAITELNPGINSWLECNSYGLFQIMNELYYESVHSDSTSIPVWCKIGKWNMYSSRHTFNEPLMHLYTWFLERMKSKPAAADLDMVLDSHNLSAFKALIVSNRVAPQEGEGTEEGPLLHRLIRKIEKHQLAVSGRYHPSRCDQCRVQESILKILLEWAEFDANLADIHGRTPLSYAAGCGNKDLVTQLLQRAEVDPVHRDHTGATPREWALRNDHPEIVELLAQYQIYDPDSWMLDDD